jgi:hypothetical protein
MKKLMLFGLLMATYYHLSAQNFNKESDINQFEKSSYTPFGNGAFGNVLSNLGLSSTLNSGVDGKIEVKTKFKNRWVGGLTVEQAIGKNDKKATFYDFTKGLTAGTKVGLNIQYTFWNPKSLSNADRKTLNELKKAYATKHSISNWRMVQIQDIEQDGVLKDKLPTYKNTNPLFFKLDGAFQKRKFSYAVDSVNLNKIDENLLTPEINFTAGYALSLSSYIAVSYSYSESYESADEMEFLKKFGTTTNLYSQTIAFGKPGFEKDHKTTIEYRKSFGEGFAIAPSVTYGFTSDKIAFSLPLYFIKGVEKDTPTGLQGGVNLGYLSSTKGSMSSFKDGFGAQLIVSAPFSVFGDLFK